VVRHPVVSKTTAQLGVSAVERETEVHRVVGADVDDMALRESTGPQQEVGIEHAPTW